MSSWTPIDQFEIKGHAHVKIPLVEYGWWKGDDLADGGDRVLMENTTMSNFPVADVPEIIAEVLIDALEFPGKDRAVGGFGDEDTAKIVNILEMQKDY